MRLGISQRNNQNYDTQEKFDKIYGCKKIKSITCKKGTLAFVNTSLVHRGKPKIELNRYALSYYAFKSKLPIGVRNSIIKS